MLIKCIHHLNKTQYSGHEVMISVRKARREISPQVITYCSDLRVDKIFIVDVICILDLHVYNFTNLVKSWGQIWLRNCPKQIHLSLSLSHSLLVVISETEAQTCQSLLS